MMAVAIPALVGATMGSGLAVGAGLVASGGIGAAIAGGIGATLVSSIVSGTNPFDDPAGAMASIAMGAMFSSAIQGLTAGEGVTIDGVESPGAVQGTSAASTLSGNIYDTAMSSSISDGMDFMSNIGYDNYEEIFSDISKVGDTSSFGSMALDNSMADQAIIKSINKSLTVNSDPSNFFNLDLSGEIPNTFNDMSVGGILTGNNEATDNYLSQAFFSPTKNTQGNLSFGPNEEMINKYQDTRVFGRYNEKDPFNLEPSKTQNKNKFPSMGGTSQSIPFKMPQIPQSVQTLMGSASSGSGTGGQGGFNDTQNKIVGPMIESYKRQQERISNIAMNTWGIQQTSRFSGLFS